MLGERDVPSRHVWCHQYHVQGRLSASWVCAPGMTGGKGGALHKIGAGAGRQQGTEAKV
jgi:hypothetical protein